MENSNAYKTQRIINSILFEQANCWMAERLADLVAGLMTDPKYSDLTLECDGEKFAVHKALVLTQSVVLEKACQGPWKEGTDNVIHIEEFDAQTVRRMVEFLYTEDYDQGKPEFVNPVIDDETLEAEGPGDAVNPGTDIESLGAGLLDHNIDAYQPSVSASESQEWGPDGETAANEFFEAFSSHLGVHAIGDYYMMGDLKEKAIEKVKVLLKKTVWSAKGFLAVAKEAFETTTPSTVPSTVSEQGETLRDIIVNVASEHFTEITQTHNFAQSGLNPEFAALLLQKAAKKHDALRTELKHEQQDNFERWIIDSRRISELMNSISHLQAQNAELDDCIKRIQELSTCRVCGCLFNVLIREDQSNDTGTNGDEDGGYNVGDSLDGLAAAFLEQERKTKKYVIECKRCKLHASRDLQSIADLFWSELPT